MSVETFINICNGPLKRYLLLSKNIGKDVEQQSEMVEQVFKSEIKYLQFTKLYEKPINDNFILKPINDQINKVLHYICGDPSLGDHINVIAQSIKALLWIKENDPVNYLEELLIDTKVYTDVLLVFFKDKEPHLEWIEAWLEVLNDLNNFVRRQYPKGLSWIGDKTLPDFKVLESDAVSSTEVNQINLNEEIKKFETVHQFLIRANDLSDTNETEQNAFQKKPVLIKEGKKWRIENYRGSHNHLTIDEAQSDNVVYIYDCYDITVVIEKKINVLKLDKCDKVCVIFRSLISGVEMMDCKNTKLHSFGTLPSVNLQVCSDINIHLTVNGLNAQVITSQCGKISLSYPLEDGYYKTFYIPNIFMTTIDEERKLKTILMKND